MVDENKNSAGCSASTDWTLVGSGAGGGGGGTVDVNEGEKPICEFEGHAPWFLTVIGMLISAALGAGIGYASHVYNQQISLEATGKASEAAGKLLQKAQLENANKQMEYQMGAQKSIQDLQKHVADLCVQKGRSPQFINGNVTCPPEGK